MKKLRWRLFLHFATQFVSIAVLMVMVILLTLFTVIIFVAEDESKHNYYQVMIESIAVDTGNSIVDMEMREGWDDGLAEEGVWVQIINQEGKVIEEGNVPENLPKQYSSHDLLKMKRTEQFNGYSLNFFLETFYKDNYLFILGHEDEANQVLQEIVSDYGRTGTISDSDTKLVEERLENIDGTLYIYNQYDDIQQQIGKGVDLKDEEVLDVLVRDDVPDTYEWKLSTYFDDDTNLYWALYTPNEKKEGIQLNSYKDVFIGFSITGAIVLIITILISIWNGFRYGNPLFIFANWLSRMGNENYAEVLTEKERKQIFRKNGKMKWRYRLYKEVFGAFYEMAEKLDSSQKERERLEKTREEWMAGISHDLRTPLTTMEGYGRLLASGEYEWSKEELEDIGKTIHEKTNYMVKLIEDFTLSFQLKYDTGQHVYQKMEVNTLIEEILEKFDKDMTLKDYVVHFIPLEKQYFIPVNRRLFERMIDNLIYNAIKHNPPGTEVTVCVLEDNDNETLIIRIEDNGVGMDEETKKNLFNRYYRGTNTDERIEGTGLGMSIALQIAKLHRGSIYVDSKENEGTRVEVRIKSVANLL